MDVADAIKVHFADSNKDLGIWFDLFSVSQHKVEVRPFEWWNSAFLDAIREIVNVLMLVQSFEKFIVCINFAKGEKGNSSMENIGKDLVCA